MGHPRAQDFGSRYRAIHLLYRGCTPYADLLEPVFTLLENHVLRGVTSTVTFAEILTKPFANKNFSLADEIKFTLKSFSSLSVALIDEKLAEAAALIRARFAI